LYTIGSQLTNHSNSWSSQRMQLLLFKPLDFEIIEALDVRHNL
jgi:hypothetical protein